MEVLKTIKTYSKKAFFFTVCFLYMADVNAQLFNQDSLKLISRQFIFTEGPAVDKKGDVFFTDQPNDKIWKFSKDGQLTVFMEKTGRSNGLHFDRKGNLIACADENNQLWSITKTGKVNVLLEDIEGKKFNGPNDLWIDSKGGIYLTDPYYQRDYWARKKPELDGEKVYYLPPGKNAKIITVAEDLKQPNGIVGTPDGKFLYVSDIGDGKTYRYAISPDATLKDKTLLISKGSDGMTLDERGNIYLTGKGVFIYDPEGKNIGHIEVPEPWTGNVCFIGKDRNKLFITASKGIYVLPMQLKGVE